MSTLPRIAYLADPPDDTLLAALERLGFGVLCTSDLSRVVAEADALSVVLVPDDDRGIWRLEQMGRRPELADVAVLAVSRPSGVEPAEDRLSEVDDYLPWPEISDAVLAERLHRWASETRARRLLARTEAALAELGDIASTLRQQSGLDREMDGIFGRICELVGSPAGALLLFGKTQQDLWVVASSDGLGGVPVPVGERAARTLLARLGDLPEVIHREPDGDGLLARALERPSAAGLEQTLTRRVDLRGRVAGAFLLAVPQQSQAAVGRVRAAVRLVAEMLGGVLEGSALWSRLQEQTQPVQLTHLNQRLRRRALRRYREFFETSSDGVVVLDASGQVAYINRAGAMITGYAEEWLKGRALGEIVVEDHRTALAEIIEQGLAGVFLQNFDLRIKTTSGDEIAVDVSASQLGADDGLLVLTFRDVTEARALEEELLQTKEFLERLIDSAVDAIVAAASTTGAILLFNSGAEALFGHSAEDALAHLTFPDLFPEEEYEELIAQIHSSQFGGVGRLAQRQIHIRDALGQHVPVAMTAASIREDGQEVALVAILSDLRETLQMQERLALAQEKLEVTERAAVIAELAGTTAHELNQPLTSVIGYSDLVLRKLEPDSPLRRPVEVIQQEAERMAEIVRKIGKITRYETKSYVGATQILDLERATDE